jgi:ferredoxin
VNQPGGIAVQQCQHRFDLIAPRRATSNNADVPTVVFEANSIGREKKAELESGGELVDLCDDILAPVPFSCRSATCGTCQVFVLEGAELLEPPEPAEHELLDVPRTRLACQARVRPGQGLVRLRPVGA